MAAYAASSRVGKEATVDATLALFAVFVIVVGLAAPLGLAWAARTGALERWPGRVEDWIDGRPWRLALLLCWPLAVPTLGAALVLPMPVWRFVVPALVVGLEFGVLWAVMSWLIRRESDEPGTSDPPAGPERR